MKTTRMIALAVLIAGSGLALHVTQAQQSGITRADVVRHDLGVPGRKIQVRVELRPRRGVPLPLAPVRSPMCSKALSSISSRASRR